MGWFQNLEETTFLLSVAHYRIIVLELFWHLSKFGHNLIWVYASLLLVIEHVSIISHVVTANEFYPDAIFYRCIAREGAIYITIAFALKRFFNKSVYSPVMTGHCRLIHDMMALTEAVYTCVEASRGNVLVRWLAGARCWLRVSLKTKASSCKSNSSSTNNLGRGFTPTAAVWHKYSRGTLTSSRQA